MAMPKLARALSALAVLALGLGIARVSGQPSKEPSHAVFGLTPIHDFHFDLSAPEWEKMQKVTGMPMFGGPKKLPEKSPDKDDIERHKSVGGFGFEFPWAKADLTENGKTFKAIGLRYKGNGS